MAIVAEQIDLQTHSAVAVLRLSNVEKSDDGSGYSCEMMVLSGDFACTRAFYFDDQSLTEAISSLRRMADGVPAEAVIKWPYEDDYLQFEMNRLGHVFVSGALHEYGDLPQSIRFAFRTDQTVLAPLLRGLESIHNA